MAVWKIRRGTAAVIAAVTLEEGEPAFTTDNHDLYLGTGAGNQFVGGASGNALTITSLGDVTITSVADNEVLAYDTSSTTWINQTALEAGIGALAVANTWTALNTFTLAPTGTGVGAGSLYVNPATATATYTLVGAAVGGTVKFKVDAEGDGTLAGGLVLAGNLDLSAGAYDILLKDAEATALEIKEGSNAYVTFVTTNDGESVTFGKKVRAGSFGSPMDVTTNGQYGVELHYSGNNYDVTGIRSRAQLKTTDASTKTAQGALIQAANNDGIDAGVLNGANIEAIGKSSTTAATISTMRGAIVNTEWDAQDTVTDLRVVHVRTHTRNAATAGYISGTGYGLYIENEAVGGNGQALNAAIYLKGTNLSGGNKAFTHGLDFTGATYGTALMTLPDDDVVCDDDANQAIANLTTAGWIKVTTPAGPRYIWLASNAPTGP